MSYIGVANSGEFLFTTDDVNRHNFGELEGDVLGTIHATIVSGIAGIPLSGVPLPGQIIQYDGLTWTYVPDATGDAVGGHNLLSATHVDTVASDPVRGGLVVGNATPAWEQLSLGLTGEVLYSNGLDATYTILGPNTPFDLGSVGAPSVVFSGDPDTGLSWGGADTLNASAGANLLFQLSGPSGNILLNGGLVHKVTTIRVNTTLGNDDHTVLVTAGGVDVTLPPDPDPGQTVIIKDRDGNAVGGAPGTRIDILGNGNTIDGNSEVRIINKYGSFTLVYNGTGEWNVI